MPLARLKRGFLRECAEGVPLGRQASLTILRGFYPERRIFRVWLGGFEIPERRAARRLSGRV